MQGDCSRSSALDAEPGRGRLAPECAHVAISREQRNAIHDELLTALSGIGDVFVATQRGEYAEARCLRERYAGVTRLLDDLGWNPEDPGERFAITMEAGELARAVAFLQARTTETLAAEVGALGQAQEETACPLRAVAAFGAILTQLAEAGWTS